MDAGATPRGAILLNAYASSSSLRSRSRGDSETYDFGGYFLAQTWAGEGTFVLRSAVSPSGYGFHYFVGALYYMFGRNQFLVQFLNATIGSLAVPVVYLIARKLFDERVARWPALFMAFFPQMIFWSCGMYKDPAILLCIALAIYGVLSLRDRFTIRGPRPLCSIVPRPDYATLLHLLRRRIRYRGHVRLRSAAGSWAA